MGARVLCYVDLRGPTQQVAGFLKRPSDSLLAKALVLPELFCLDGIEMEVEGLWDEHHCPEGGAWEIDHRPLGDVIAGKGGQEQDAVGVLGRSER